MLLQRVRERAFRVRVTNDDMLCSDGAMVLGGVIGGWATAQVVEFLVDENGRSLYGIDVRRPEHIT